VKCEIKKECYLKMEVFVEGCSTGSEMIRFPRDEREVLCNYFNVLCGQRGLGVIDI
jgi:hypothetical protein